MLDWVYWDRGVKEIKSCRVVCLFLMRALLPGCSGNRVVKETKVRAVFLWCGWQGIMIIEEIKACWGVGWRIRQFKARGWFYITWSYRMGMYVCACTGDLSNRLDETRRSAGSLSSWYVGLKAGIIVKSCVGVNWRWMLFLITLIEIWFFLWVCLSKLQFALECGSANSLGKEHANSHRLKHFIILTEDRFCAI